MLSGGSIGVGFAAVLVAATSLLAMWCASRGRSSTASGRGVDRGVSEVIGIVLLFGLVMAGATAVIITGSQAKDAMREQNRMESAEIAMKTVDSRVGTLSTKEEPVTLSSPGFAGRETGRVDVEETTSTVAFSINGSAACTGRVELGSIRYTDEKGRWIAYEGGGVWRNDSGDTQMVSPPDLRYDNGTVNFVAENLSGRAHTTGKLSASRQGRQSANQTQAFVRDMLVHDGTGDLCAPRESLEITIHSPYYEAWADYLRSEFPDSVSAAGDLNVFPAQNKVTMILDDDELRDFDSDGDGAVDDEDNCPGKFNPDQRDTDGDGKGDACDPDDDGDGIPDSSDMCVKAPPPGGASTHSDADGDGIGDVCDPDADGDGWYDGGTLPAPYQGSYDMDQFRKNGTVEDNCPGPGNYNPAQTDTDSDGQGDVCDPDDDDPDESGSPEPRDTVDTCPKIYNETNTDLDGGGRGDPCDPDDDGDGYYDSVDPAYRDGKGIDTSKWAGKDNCPDVPNPSQTDTDGDGKGDACDDDRDGDTVPNDHDNCPDTPNRDQRNTDAKNGGNPTDNPRGDACDPDDDGDGVPDTTDNCPKVYNPGQDARACASGGGGGGGGGGGSPPPFDDHFVDVQNVDGTTYRRVPIYAKVNTPAGKNGKLTKSDFSVYEDGVKRPIVSVKFTEGTKVDIVFVFDDTGSMGGEIADMQNNVKNFANGLEAAGIDARYALVSFKDDNDVDQHFTANVGTFKSAVDAMYAAGGGDGPEDSFDAIDTGTDLHFRDGAQKVVVHITDYRSHSDSRSSTNQRALTNKINAKGISYYSVSPPWPPFKQIAHDTGGEWMDIHSGSGFKPFLDDIRKDLTSRYKVTFKSCRPADGSSRDVMLYADSGGRTGRGESSYVAPSGGAPDTCYSPPTPDPEPDSDLPDFSHPPITPNDDPLPPPPSCSGVCNPTDRAKFGIQEPPKPYTTVISVRVDVIDVEPE